MRKSYEIAFPLVVGLEGRMSDDPDDPGGFTIWGLASRYNPEVTRDTTLSEAKAIYLRKYWIPNGCDEAPFPMDICLFDGSVNPQNDPDLPGAGNRELLALNPENWQEFLIMRMRRYMKKSKEKYVKGHIFRVLRLYDAINIIEKERKG